MSITAIIVTHNSSEIVAQALECIIAHPKISKCIVVDNASQDSTLEVIKAGFFDILLIKNTENIGFGKACNAALELVDTEYALLLNPDATIDELGINRLLSVFLLNSEAAIVAPFIENKGVENSTESFRLPAIYNGDPTKFYPDKSKDFFEVFFISGSVSLWKMDVMKKIGFFDPKIFMFYEDDDISIRVAKAGYKMFLVNGVNATHMPGMSSKASNDLNQLKYRSSLWSYLYLNKKYKGFIYSKILATKLMFESKSKLKLLEAEFERISKTSKFIEYYGNDQSWIDLQKKELQLWAESSAVEDNLWKQSALLETYLWSSLIKLEEQIWFKKQIFEQELWSKAGLIEEDLWKKSLQSNEDLWQETQAKKEQIWSQVQQSKENIWQETKEKRELAWQNTQLKKQQLLLEYQTSKDKFLEKIRNQNEYYLSLVNKIDEEKNKIISAKNFLKNSNKFKIERCLR